MKGSWVTGRVLHGRCGSGGSKPPPAEARLPSVSSFQSVAPKICRYAKNRIFNHCFKLKSYLDSNYSFMAEVCDLCLRFEPANWYIVRVRNLNYETAEKQPLFYLTLLHITICRLLPVFPFTGTACAK
jgi:hypothetical protein